MIFGVQCYCSKLYSGQSMWCLEIRFRKSWIMSGSQFSERFPYCSEMNFQTYSDTHVHPEVYFRIIRDVSGILLITSLSYWFSTSDFEKIFEFLEIRIWIVVKYNVNLPLLQSCFLHLPFFLQPHSFFITL